MKKRTIWTKVGDFLEGKGFYIVLALCLVAIGGSGYYLYRTMSLAGSMPTQTVSAQAEVPADVPEPDFVVSDPDDGEAVNRAAEAEQEDEKAAETGIVEENPTEQAEGDEDLEAEPTAPTATEAQPEQSEEQSDEESPSVSTGGWSWPLEGEVAEAFSAEQLTYNAALDDWRTHTGIDLAAQVGDPVASATPGTVMAVKDDVMLGRTVTVQTPDGLSVIYGNLAEDVAVTSGDEVEAGQILGSVGETAAGESHDTGWLHFAVEQDGVAVDPLNYLDN